MSTQATTTSAGAAGQTYKSPLHQMALTTETALWNDSCSRRELEYAIDHGAVGATSNPVIVGTVLRQELASWEGRIEELIAERATATEEQLAWQIAEEISVTGAALLADIFTERNGRDGRLSIQTDPRNYRSSKAILRQAEHFHQLAPNIIVKIPVTAAGLTAIEEATFRGISVNGTVSFTVPQAIAVAEAVERGLSRREADGKDISTMGPICTMMVGRLDDWLKAVAERDDIIADPRVLEWAGVAAMKKAYAIYRERGYRLRLLAAAYRNHLHWSQFIGGDVIVTIPHLWQRRFNGSDVEVKPRMDEPVDAAIIEELLAKFADFRRAYAEDGMPPEEFERFGSSVQTLRQFIGGWHDLVATIRTYMLPDLR